MTVEEEERGGWKGASLVIIPVLEPLKQGGGIGGQGEDGLDHVDHALEVAVATGKAPADGGVEGATR